MTIGCVYFVIVELSENRKHHPEHLWLDSEKYHSSQSYDIYEWF